MNLFRKPILGIAVLLSIVLPGCASKPLEGVIITGQNNHNWPVSHQVIKEILENSGMFRMDVAVSPAAGEDMSGFSVDFRKYSFVVLDYNGDDWPEPMKKAFEEYMRDGGGAIIYHAADNSFPGWDEYNRIIALGGWGDRDENSGPYVYFRDGELVKDDSPGPGGSHGERRPYLMHGHGSAHPVAEGLPSEWMHAEDELYDRLRGPGNIGEVLYSAFAEPDMGGSGREEPLVFTVDYGKARIMHIALGHCGATADDNPAMQCAGFQTILLRSAEWCASGKVTQEVPADFPTDSQVSIRR